MAAAAEGASTAARTATTAAWVAATSATSNGGLIAHAQSKTQSKTNMSTDAVANDAAESFDWRTFAGPNVFTTARNDTAAYGYTSFAGSASVRGSTCAIVPSLPSVHSSAGSAFGVPATVRSMPTSTNSTPHCDPNADVEMLAV
jgi:hypothetical protein